ncbi:hypothetical protein CRG98_007423 [Punica granatum]|uniref:Reverse transcriptase Ty1/copia-type domain-containing protein n=1 Tax=Punica granatum TaxID=22663 RepID=A0A2I0KUS7_PUNGR|nr:hypothetical protein CRG98_007423 [Punica granatum]
MVEKKPIDPMSPYYIGISDNPEAKNKVRFVEGSIKEPELTDPFYRAWKVNNSMIASWLFNSLDTSVQATVMHAQDAKTITNGSEEQRNREGTSVPHGTEFKHIYETVRSQIPNADPLPTLNRARGMVREGERRWNIAQGRNEQMDSSAFLARGTNGPGGRIGSKGNVQDSMVEETTVGGTLKRLGMEKKEITGTNKEDRERVNMAVQKAQLAQINDNPLDGPDGKAAESSIESNSVAAFQAGQNGTTTAHISALSDEQYQQLVQIFGKNSISSEQSSGEKVLTGSLTNWVLDTGASMHMTGDADMLLQPNDMSPAIYVTIPNGKSVPATRRGSVQLGPSIILKNDRTTGRTIGSGELSRGVYWLKRAAPSAGTSTALMATNKAGHELWNWDLYLLNVNNTFLHGVLEEEVCMRPPPVYNVLAPNQACRLRKSLYGLRQASRNRFPKFSVALKDYGFEQSAADYSLFTYSREGIFMVVLVYVDDLILTGNDPSSCSRFKQYLDHCFHIKDLGKLKYFVGIEVARTTDNLFLCQRKYTLDILTECGIGARPVNLPMEQNLKLTSDSGGELQDPFQYRRLVGQLIYLTISRLELSYPVHILPQIMKSPRQQHWNAALRILHYLKQSPGVGRRGTLCPLTSPFFLQHPALTWYRVVLHETRDLNQSTGPLD